jgi:hypothetical protein
MAITHAVATVRTLGQLFNSNAFIVPDYQRSYAWETRKTSDSKDHQVEDFWEDIKDAFYNNKTQLAAGKDPQQYYWGTLTLKRNLLDRRDGLNAFPEYSIVDGQQRLTTAMLLLIAFNNPHFLTINPDFLTIPRNFLMIGTDPKLKVSTLNINAFSDLVSNSRPVRDIHLRTNERLLNAVDYFVNQIRLMPLDDIDLLLKFFYIQQSL